MRNQISTIKASYIAATLIIFSAAVESQDAPVHTKPENQIINNSIPGEPPANKTENTHPTDGENSGAISETATKPSPLAEELAKQLGITSDQGAAGAGSILRYVKQKLDEDDYKRISDLIPGIHHILTTGPTAADTELVESVAVIESENPEVASIVLKNNFDLIGLAPDMVEKFIPIMIDYVKTQGGETDANLLKTALRGI